MIDRLKFGRVFRKQTKKSTIVIGEPYDVKHVYHVGLDTALTQSQPNLSYSVDNLDKFVSEFLFNFH